MKANTFDITKHFQKLYIDFLARTTQRETCFISSTLSASVLFARLMSVLPTKFKLHTQTLLLR